LRVARVRCPERSNAVGPVLCGDGLDDVVPVQPLQSLPEVELPARALRATLVDPHECKPKVVEESAERIVHRRCVAVVDDERRVRGVTGRERDLAGEFGPVPDLQIVDLAVLCLGQSLVVVQLLWRNVIGAEHLDVRRERSFAAGTLDHGVALTRVDPAERV